MKAIINRQITLAKPNTWKTKVMSFCFPFYPVKWRNSIHLMMLLASLIGLRLLTQIFSFPVGPSLRISFNWIPTALIGWMFGPVLSLLIGIIVDSITFFISGGVWFWMYAIQEPLIMMLAGIIGSIYRLRLNGKSIIYDYFVFQIITLIFLITGIVVLLQYSYIELNNNNVDILGVDKNVTLILTLTSLITFFVVVQTILHLIVFRNKVNKKYPKLFIYVGLLGMLLSIIFSFVLGTVAAINYYYYISGSNEPSSNFVLYGAYYYLIPRVIKETFKIPFFVLILTGIIKLAEPNLALIKQMKYQKW